MMARAAIVYFLFSALIFITSACKKDTEIIIPVHQASLEILKDFRDFKKCVSSQGDTFIARHFADTVWVSGESVNRQRPVYQIVRHVLIISEIDTEITFEINALYDSESLTRIYDKATLKIVSNDLFNEMTISNLPKEWICINNCDYKEILELVGQTYRSVIFMRLPDFPNLFYSFENDGKFVGFSCSEANTYRWID